MTAPSPAGEEVRLGTRRVSRVLHERSVQPALQPASAATPLQVHPFIYMWTQLFSRVDKLLISQMQHDLPLPLTASIMTIYLSLPCRNCGQLFCGDCVSNYLDFQHEEYTHLPQRGTQSLLQVINPSAVHRRHNCSNRNSCGICIPWSVSFCRTYPHLGPCVHHLLAGMYVEMYGCSICSLGIASSWIGCCCLHVACW